MKSKLNMGVGAGGAKDPKREGSGHEHAAKWKGQRHGVDGIGSGRAPWELGLYSQT